MAGKPGRSGRKPKADALKLAKGTYRPTVSGDPETKPKATGEPDKPEFDLEEASEFWDEYVPELITMGVAKHTDGPRLQALAEAWALLRKATKIVNANPIDKDNRIAYAEYSRTFANAAAEFGLNPSARSRIIIDKPAEPAIRGRARG